MEVQKNNETVDNFLSDEQQELEAVRCANFVRELIVGKFNFQLTMLFFFFYSLTCGARSEFLLSHTI